MAYEFRHSLRALEGGGRNTLGIIAALVLLAVWGLWFALGQVSVYVTSQSSRIEVAGAAHNLESVVEGRVLSADLQLGGPVKKGAALVVLDAEEEKLRLREERTRRSAAGAALEALRLQVTAEERALAGYRHLVAAARGEAEARMREGQAAANYAVDEARRAEALFSERYLSQAEYERLSSEAARQNASKEALGFASHRAASEGRVAESDRVARLRALRTEERKLEGDCAALDASLRRLEVEIDKYTLRAPAAGIIAHLSPVKPGSVLKRGTVVATIVPDTELEIVAAMPAASALGRVRPGQRARLRLDGFPWTQYGTLEARVARVGQESHDGGVRVELTAARGSAPGISLRHGLSGSVEVEVERVAPAALVLRRVARPLGAAQ